uniref:RanBD1 domain-containing protein n=1 Tax=Globodera pallida TaxID=36090 RepID=A0A183CDD0_GLOPA
MSKDLYPLYPSNSKVIDLRNKITPAPVSKTKQFFNELQKISASSPSKAYESERWFTPRADTHQDDTSAPPRRSMFTPSRLQILSAQRGREARKPYWRCPMPSTKPSEMSNIERILQEGSSPSSSLTLGKQLMPPPPASIPLTPTVRQGPMKSFVRRRDPENGIMNKFSVDEDILTIDANEENNDALDKVQPLTIAPKAGFLGELGESLFTFSEPTERAPRLDTKETGTQTDQIVTTTPSPVAVQNQRESSDLERVTASGDTTTTTFGSTAPAGGFQFVSAAPVANGNAFQLAEAAPNSSSGTIQHGATGGGFSFAVPPNGDTTTTTTTFPETFSFGNTAPVGGFQFANAAPVTNGNAFQFAEAPNSSSGTVRHGISARKLLMAKRKKR